MKRLLFLIAVFLLPELVWAQTAADLTAPGVGLSLTPPPTDVSIEFLEDIFGIVDGVLHGGGSQLLGTLFGIFNAAVLALGTILGGYVILVSTLVTAQDGQVLGQKWSSIWIPLRLVFGLAMLFPKASGYSIVQIFVMWVVVQGVGAADSIWNVALQYFLRGGVIVQGAEPNVAIKPPPTAQDATTQTGEELAGDVLNGLVCMYGLQQSLINQRQAGIDAGLGDPNGEVPSFSTTLTNVVTLQPNSDGVVSLPIPNLPNDQYNAFYSSFNGACGTLTWTMASASTLEQQYGVDDALKDTTDVSKTTVDPFFVTMAADIFTSRSAAVQAMLNDLMLTAQAIANNYYQTNVTPLPYGTIQSQNIANVNYELWVSDQPPNPPLLQGTELTDAYNDYQTIITPTLRIQAQAAKNYQMMLQQKMYANKTGQPVKLTDSQKAMQQLLFARLQGWLSAGQYYFVISALNQNSLNTSGLYDILPVMNLGTEYITAAQPGTYDYFGNLQQSYRDNLNSLVNGAAFQAYVKNAETFNPGVSNPDQENASGDILEPFNTGANAVGGAASTVSGGIQVAQNWDKKWYKSWEKSTIRKQIKKIKNSDLRKFISTATDYIFGGKGVGVILDAINQMVNAVNEFAGFARSLQGLATNQTTVQDPIVLVSNFGRAILNGAAAMWIGGGFAVVVTTALTSFASCVNSIPYAILAFLMWFVPLWSFLLGIMFSSGIMMEYYVPLIPFLIYSFAAIGWFIGVIEAMIAAPLLGLAIAVPEGHDALGKAVNGFVLLIGVFLRPSLMLFGYFSGMILSYVSLWLINMGFFYSAGTIFQQMVKSDSGYSAFIFPFAVIAIYMGIVVFIIQKSYSMIHVIPDKILRWVGGQAETLGGDVSGGAEQVKSGFEGGAKDFGGKVSQPGSGSLQTLKDAKGGGGGGGGKKEQQPEKDQPPNQSPELESGGGNQPQQGGNSGDIQVSDAPKKSGVGGGGTPPPVA